jgi:acetamidase/formamidase
MHVTIPFLESASHLISKGFQKLLDEAIRCALRQMAGPVAARSGIGVDQAYMLLGHDKDLQITPVIDGKKVFESIICTPPEIAPSPLVPRSISWRNRLPSR